MATKKTKKEAVEVLEAPELKVAEITKDLKKIEKKAEPLLSITSADGYQEATAFIVEVKGRINRIKDLKTKYVKPLKENIKALESLFNEPLEHYEGIEYKLKGAMSAYQREQDRLAREEEARLAKQREKKEAKTGVMDPTPLPVVEREAPTVKVDAGKATSKKVWKFEVEDIMVLMEDAKFRAEVLQLAVTKGLHEQVVRTKVNAGVREIKGVRIYEDFEISVSA